MNKKEANHNVEVHSQTWGRKKNCEHMMYFVKKEKKKNFMLTCSSLKSKINCPIQN